MVFHGMPYARIFASTISFGLDLGLIILPQEWIPRTWPLFAIAVLASVYA